MHPSWQEALRDQRPALDSLETKLADLPNLTPSSDKVMRALEMPVQAVRVLIVGQDPYPELSVACGLAFAIAQNQTNQPASLRNIVKELRSDQPTANSGGNLEAWSSQGVLLLNRHLTTLVGQSNAHAKVGWQGFTDAVIEALVAAKGRNFVALLWGNRAQELGSKLGAVPIVAGVHPSPLSAYRGFFGSRPFTRVNEYLLEQGLEPIDWQL